MDIDLKKLYTLLMETLKSAEQNFLNAKFARDNEERDSSFRKFCELQEKARALHNIFWISVKDTFGLWNKDSVGVRKGFKVVWGAVEEAPLDIADFIRRLMED